MSSFSLCKLLGINYPIILAPMAGDAVSIDLICEVARLKGLASLGAGYMTKEVLDTALTLITSRTKAPLMVNFFARSHPIFDRNKAVIIQKLLTPFADELNISLQQDHQDLPPLEEQIHIALKHQINIMSFTFGAPSEKILEQLKEKKIFLIGTATHEKEGIYLKKLGFDAVVAQGKEAGGHRSTFLSSESDGLIPTFSLTSLLREKLHLPIIASGGIMEASDIKKATEHGASAVQMGTAFLTTHESSIDKVYKEELLAHEKDHTILTSAFSGKMARALPNRFTKIMNPHEENFLPFPYQHYLTKPIRDAASKTHRKELMSLWSGQRNFLCKKVSCETLMKDLCKVLDESESEN